MKKIFLLTAMLLTFVLSAQAATNVLFVVADVNNLTATTGDGMVRNRLVLLGASVTVMNAPATSAADANGKDLIVISETVTSGDVNTKFKNVTVPVIDLEAALFDDFAFTNPTGAMNGSDFGDAFAITQVNILSPAHPMAAGLSGTVTAVTSSQNCGWITTSGPDVIKIAAATNDTTKLTAFAYDTGTRCYGNFIAPARRVGLFERNNCIQTLTADGWKLFDAAYYWVTGTSNPNQPDLLTKVPYGAYANYVIPNIGLAGHFTMDSFSVQTGTKASPYVTQNGLGDGRPDIAGIPDNYSQDYWIKKRLTDLGANVVTAVASSVTAADAEGKDLIVLTETAPSADVNTKFQNVAVPLIALKMSFFKNLGMTGTADQTDAGDNIGGQTDITITNPNHPLAAGLAGQIKVINTGDNPSWGKTFGTGVTTIASLQGGDNNKFPIFAYDKGAALFGGAAAPARRVGFLARANIPYKLNATGWQLFDAAYNWARTTPAAGAPTVLLVMKDWSKVGIGGTFFTSPNGPGGLGTAVRRMGGSGSVAWISEGQNDFTVSFWIKTFSNGNGGINNLPDARNFWDNAIINGDRGGYGWDDWGICLTKGRIGVGMDQYTTAHSDILANRVSVVSNKPINDGKWHWVFVTRDGISGVVTIAIDDGQFDWTQGTLFPGTHDATMNEWATAPAQINETFPAGPDMLVDDFYMYKRKLSDLELFYMYIKSSGGGAPSDFVKHFSFDDILPLAPGGIKNEVVPNADMALVGMTTSSLAISDATKIFTTTTAKIGGKAIQFKGAQLASAITFSNLTWTVCMWVKTKDVPPWGNGDTFYNSWYLYGYDVGGVTRDYAMGIQNNGIVAGADEPAMEAGIVVRANAAVNNGQWHHVAWARNGENGDMKLTIDGILRSDPMANLPNPNAGPEWAISDTRFLDNRFTNIVVDDILLYTRYLTNDEINLIYNANTVNAIKKTQWSVFE